MRMLRDLAPDGSRVHGTPRALLISIQPRFAQAILDGTKSIELRRTRPTLEPNAQALIYASSPTKAIIGTATVTQIFQDKPEGLWATHKDATGVTAAEFTEYFEGAKIAYGLELLAVQRIDGPVALSELRQRGLEPPQSWRYLDGALAALLSNRESAAPSLAV